MSNSGNANGPISQAPENLIQYGRCSLVNSDFEQSTAGNDFAILTNKSPLLALDLGLKPNDTSLAASKAAQFSIPLTILPFKTDKGYEISYTIHYGTVTTAGMHACLVIDLNGELEFVNIPFGESTNDPLKVINHISSIVAPDGLSTVLVISVAILVQRQTILDNGIVTVDGIDVSVRVKV